MYRYIVSCRFSTLIFLDSYPESPMFVIGISGDTSDYLLTHIPARNRMVTPYVIIIFLLMRRNAQDDICADSNIHLRTFSKTERKTSTNLSSYHATHGRRYNLLAKTFTQVQNLRLDPLKGQSHKFPSLQHIYSTCCFPPRKIDFL